MLFFLETCVQHRCLNIHANYLYIEMCFSTMDLYASESQIVFFLAPNLLRVNFIPEPLNKFRLILSVLGADALAPLSSEKNLMRPGLSP
jgi:hypothetical protein